MNPAITVELQFFLVSILWGGILLLAYDVVRIFRRIIKHSVFFIAVQDLIFWVMASLFIFAMIYEENNGIIRGFSIMGMLIGTVLYHTILSDILVNSITKLIRIILRPLEAAFHQISRVIRSILSHTRKLKENLLFRLKKGMKSVKIALKTRKQ